MILLGLNAGFEASDLCVVTQNAIDGAWLTFARVKPGIDRRIPLWSETIDAIKCRARPKDPADSDLVFVTQYGRRRVRMGPATSTRSAIPSTSCCAPDLQRPGVGFYAHRHTFETIGGGAGDQVAVDAVMGHVNDDVASAYREHVSDDPCCWSRITFATGCGRGNVNPASCGGQDDLVD